MPSPLAPRRARVAAALQLTNEVLLLGAGEAIPLPENSDQSYTFITHSEHAYLAENACQGAVVAFDPLSGEWIDFVPHVSEGERVWEGREQTPGRLLSDLDSWMGARPGRPVIMLGAPLRTIHHSESLTARARERLTHARRVKEDSEVTLMRKAAQATAAGYARLREILVPGITERALQIELEAEFFRNGANQTGFSSIVGTGPNSAVLHFSPGERRVQAGDFVLVDSGAQVGRYTADVTRTFCAGRPEPFKRDLHAVVLAAQQTAITRCRPGAEWKDIHLACAMDLVSGLRELGIFRGNPEDLVEQEAHTLFFPHGLGHMVGLGVRDASGVEPGRARDPRPCLRTLRMDLPLTEGYLVTVEPGLYFIPALLQDPVRRSRYADVVDWSLVDRHLGVGGVRVEDDVLVTAAGPEVLTGMIPHGL